MSEHQVYEFIAVDKPLSAEDIATLRGISSRAEISPTRFWNEYSWGDLKARPGMLLRRYFDAHLYYANWGGYRLMLRFPVDRVDLERWSEYFVGVAASCEAAGEHVVVDISPEDEPGDYGFNESWSLSSLIPLRAELMEGDLRGAYLVWLLSVERDELEDDALEPPVPPGLASLTSAQQELVDFFGVDRGLLAAAAEGSGELGDDRDEFARWVAELSPDEKQAWLDRAVSDPQLALGSELRRVFRAGRPAAAPAGRRSVAELRAAADAR